MFGDALDLLCHWQYNDAAFEIPPAQKHRQKIHTLLDLLFRKLGLIDWLLGQLCDLGKCRRDLQCLLRIGACRLLYGEILPPPVVIDTCVRLASRRFSRHQANFVNAVLRRLQRERRQLLEQPPEPMTPSARHNLGSELIEQWRSHLGPEEVARLAELAQTPAPMIVRRRGDRAAAPENASPAEALLQPLPALPWLDGQSFFICAKPREFLASTAFRRGLFYIQDPATALAPAMLQATPGEKIADLCAAPGGKTLLLAEAMREQGLLVAADRDLRRLGRLRENLRGTEAALTVADAAAPPFRRGGLDGVLLDLPCTNTGVVRRRPDVRWRFSRQLMARLTEMQQRILDGAAPLVANGGRLVYSTCSIEPEENEERIRDFLATHPQFKLERETRLMPGEWHDGAYAALLRRKP